MKLKILELQLLLQEECKRLGSNHTVIVRQQDGTQISIASFDKNTMSERDGWYSLYDNFFGECIISNFESALTMIYLSVLGETKLWETYKDRILKSNKWHG